MPSLTRGPRYGGAAFSSLARTRKELEREEKRESDPDFEKKHPRGKGEAGGQFIHSGTSGAVADAVRSKLGISSDVGGKAFKRRVSAFQERKGINVDGRIGSQTIGAAFGKKLAPGPVSRQARRLVRKKPRAREALAESVLPPIAELAQRVEGYTYHRDGKTIIVAPYTRDVLAALAELGKSASPAEKMIVRSEAPNVPDRTVTVASRAGGTTTFKTGGTTFVEKSKIASAVGAEDVSRDRNPFPDPGKTGDATDDVGSGSHPLSKGSATPVALPSEAPKKPTPPAPKAPSVAKVPNDRESIADAMKGAGEKLELASGEVARIDQDEGGWAARFGDDDVVVDQTRTGLAQKLVGRSERTSSRSEDRGSPARLPSDAKGTAPKRLLRGSYVSGGKGKHGSLPAGNLKHYRVAGTQRSEWEFKGEDGSSGTGATAEGAAAAAGNPRTNRISSGDPKTSRGGTMTEWKMTPEQRAWRMRWGSKAGAYAVEGHSFEDDGTLVLNVRHRETGKRSTQRSQSKGERKGGSPKDPAGERESPASRAARRAGFGKERESPASRAARRSSREVAASRVYVSPAERREIVEDETRKARREIKPNVVGITGGKPSASGSQLTAARAKARKRAMARIEALERSRGK